MKKGFFNFLAVIIILSTLPFHGYAETIKVDYLALGDSLAAGINEQNVLTEGYADYLAQHLDEIGVLNSFNKGFAYPGYKTVDVQSDLEKNKEKPIVAAVVDGKPIEKELVTIKEAIKQAELITLSIGANDVLANLNRNADGTFTFDIAKVLASVEETTKNIAAIITALQQINPNVKIVLMGYYNPFPTLTAYKFELEYLVSSLDTAVAKVATQLGVTFVDVKADIAANAATYLPNVNNIHLSAAGYEAVAKAMFNTLNYTPDKQPSISLPKDVATDFWGAPFIAKAIEKGIFNGNADGTFNPNGSLTRIQMASLMKRQFKLPESSVNLPFLDVKTLDEKITAELKAVYAYGIVNGLSKERFNPNGIITREQFALVLLRTHEKSNNQKYEAKANTTFTDINGLAEESQRAIKFLAELKLVDAVQKFNPDGKLTRAQAAKILVNYQEQQ